MIISEIFSDINISIAVTSQMENVLQLYVFCHIILSLSNIKDSLPKQWVGRQSVVSGEHMVHLKTISRLVVVPSPIA